MKYFAWLIALVVVLGSPFAHADGSAEATAREYYRTASVHFDAGRYLDAQAAFAAGYELSHKPGFLWNMAECARLLNNPPRAIELYRQYLGASGENAPRQADAEQRIKELEELPGAMRAGAPTGDAGAPGAASTTPAAIVHAPPPRAAEPNAASSETKSAFFAPTPAPVEGARPITTRWWFWTAAAGVAVASVVTVAILANAHASSNAPAPPSGNFTVSWK